MDLSRESKLIAECNRLSSENEMLKRRLAQQRAVADGLKVVVDSFDRDGARYAVTNDGKEVETWQRVEALAVLEAVPPEEPTCRVESAILIEGEYVPAAYYEYTMECDEVFNWDDEEPPAHCPGCGRRIMR